MSTEEKIKFEDDQRKFALAQAQKDKELINVDLQEFRKKERYVNPITRVAGQETSSEKMRLMWIELQKMLQQDEQIKKRLIVLKNNFTVDNINEMITELQDLVYNAEDNLSGSQLLRKEKSIKRLHTLTNRKNNISSQMLRPMDYLSLKINRLSQR